MIQRPKGTKDIFAEIPSLTALEMICRSYASFFDYKEIRTPIFESLDLFKRAVGDETDVVSKEMYDFVDKGERHMALRPENTAGVVRAYIENKMYALPNQPVKMFYMGPQFRYERPQDGRQRQFHQFGIEAIGLKSPRIDAEQIILANSIISTLGIKNYELQINSLGDKESRNEYKNKLRAHFEKFEDEICDDCKRRIDTNILRVLDCKVCGSKKSHTSAPSLLESLSAESKAYFEQVEKIISAAGIKYTVNTRLVRGLDYYCDTVFEFVSLNKEKGQTTICGGGRYDGLVSQLGGPDVSGIGFAMGIERLLLTLEAEGVDIAEHESTDVVIIGTTEAAKDFSILVANVIASAGFTVAQDYTSTNIKKQFTLVERKNAKVAIIIGEAELDAGKLTIKNQANKEERSISMDDIIPVLDEMIGE